MILVMFNLTDNKTKSFVSVSQLIVPEEYDWRGIFLLHYSDIDTRVYQIVCVKDADFYQQNKIFISKKTFSPVLPRALWDKIWLIMILKEWIL